MNWNTYLDYVRDTLPDPETARLALQSASAVLRRDPTNRKALGVALHSLVSLAEHARPGVLLEWPDLDRVTPSALAPTEQALYLDPGQPHAALLRLAHIAHAADTTLAALRRAQLAARWQKITGVG